MQHRNVPEDDIRSVASRDIIAKIQKKNNLGRPAEAETPQEGESEQEHGDEMHVAAPGDESTVQDFDADENQSSEYVAEDQGSEHVAAVGESRTAL